MLRKTKITCKLSFKLMKEQIKSNTILNKNEHAGRLGPHLNP